MLMKFFFISIGWKFHQHEIFFHQHETGWLLAGVEEGSQNIMKKEIRGKWYEGSSLDAFEKFMGCRILKQQIRLRPGSPVD